LCPIRLPIGLTPAGRLGRNSPDAEPLVRAADALVRANPDMFPRVFSSIFVVFGKTVPTFEGYQPEDPIREVLESVGVLDEPDSWSQNHSHNASASHYVVTLSLD
jgi:hypothetical protein